MSDPVFEHLRHGALDMLADGNSVESVAHVLEVPVDVVTAWRADPPVAAAPDVTAPADDDRADERIAAPRLSFDSTLEYSASTTFRLTSLALTCALGGGGYWLVRQVFRLHPGPVATVAAIAAIVLVFGWAMTNLLAYAGRLLVLYPDTAVIPGNKYSRRMPYADVASWSLAPHRETLAPGIGYKGQMLTIASRDPEQGPFEVFVFDAYPIAPRLLRRLDEVVAANRRRA